MRSTHTSIFRRRLKPCKINVADRLEITKYGQAGSRAETTIQRGTEITAVPYLLGCEFDPPKSSVRWVNDWHRIEFKFRVLDHLKVEPASNTVFGMVSFYVGPILVGQTAFPTHLDSRPSGTSEGGGWALSACFEAIFVSYSHDDKVIVDRLKQHIVRLD